MIVPSDLFIYFWGDLKLNWYTYPHRDGCMAVLTTDSWRSIPEDKRYAAQECFKEWLNQCGYRVERCHYDFQCFGPSHFHLSYSV